MPNKILNGSGPLFSWAPSQQPAWLYVACKVNFLFIYIFEELSEDTDNTLQLFVCLANNN